MLAIQKDIDTLTKYAAIGFDGLPEALRPVLASVESGNMPKRWRTAGQATPVPLEQGLQGTEWSTCMYYRGFLFFFRGGGGGGGSGTAPLPTNIWCPPLGMKVPNAISCLACTGLGVIELE